MDRCSGRRAHWPDEEREEEWIDFDRWVQATAGLCGRCGQRHETKACPNVQEWMLK